MALAGTTGRRKFYVLNRATGSSLFPPNDPVILEYSGRSYAGVRRVIDVDCMSLADFLAEHQRPVPVLMKLDTQGTELEILSSLSAAQLESLTVVELEVEFLELYKGQPTFGDVHAFMQGQGFRLLDLRTHRSYRNAEGQPYHYLRKYLNTSAGSSALSAELVAGDALYIRESRVQEPAASVAELATTLCLLRLYGFYDLAFWLVEKAAREVNPQRHRAPSVCRGHRPRRAATEPCTASGRRGSPHATDPLGARVRRLRGVLDEAQVAEPVRSNETG